MNPIETETPEDRDVPQAVIRKATWSLSIIWIIPMIAAVVAAYLVYSRFQQLGPTIVITFQDGSGLKAGQTPVNYRGVQIGQVTDVKLSDDNRSVVVKARLQNSAASVAREGSLFWTVRPEVGIGNITGLGTVITGPEIDVLPGSGKEQLQFAGLERAPLAVEEKGLRIILQTDQLGSLRTGSPVYYRGVEVGTIREAQLSPSSEAVQIHVVIRQRYAKLVQIGSRFWNSSGVDVNFSLLRGLEVNMDSLKSLAFGGIAFATPDGPNDQQARDGSLFALHDKPQKEWLAWAPKIQLVLSKQPSDRIQPKSRPVRIRPGGKELFESPGSALPAR